MNNAPTGNGTPEVGSGFLEISEKGFGFLRSADHHFQPKPTDIFVTPDTIKKNFLREGALVEGALNPPHRGQQSAAQVGRARQRDAVQRLHQSVPVREPDHDRSHRKVSARDDIRPARDARHRHRDPIGKGTRGIIVAPPRTGKTTFSSKSPMR
jgi:transcription termination factor Rho